MESLAEAGGKLEDAVVGHEDDDIARGIQNCGADLAGFEMFVDLAAQSCVHIALDVSGDVLPDVFAVDPHARPHKRPLRLVQTLSVAGPAPFAALREPDAAGLSPLPR